MKKQKLVYKSRMNNMIPNYDQNYELIGISWIRIQKCTTLTTQSVFTCSKLTKETPEQGPLPQMRFFLYHPPLPHPPPTIVAILLNKQD